MKIDIPQLVFHARKTARVKRPPRAFAGPGHGVEKRRVQRHGRTGKFPVRGEDVLEEVRKTQVGWENLEAPINKQGHVFSEPELPGACHRAGLLPLWKILSLAGPAGPARKAGRPRIFRMFMADEPN
jgi:hypothetical protein